MFGTAFSQPSKSIKNVTVCFPVSQVLNNKELHKFLFEIFFLSLKNNTVCVIRLEELNIIELLSFRTEMGKIKSRPFLQLL